MTLTALLGALAACLCDEFDDVCQCGLLPGSEAALDHCGSCSGDVCGQAWVLFESLYRSTTFPAQDEGEGCATPLAALIQIGVARCVPVPSADGSPPEQTELTAAALKGALDAVRVMTSVGCCLENSDVRYVVGPWTTDAPSGGCVSGSLRMSVEVTI